MPAVRAAPSPNQDDRPAGTIIDTIVLHYTGMQSAQAAIDRLRDPAAAVSSHYVVEEDGAVWQLVDEARRAFHAGISYWRGNRALNGRSIGIEIVNPGHDWGYRAFPAAQMQAVLRLCQCIDTRHPIDARNIVAHSDIAPDRKRDPGELFPWAWLAANHVGLWPGPPTPARAPLDVLLAEIGYDTTLPQAVAAFQLHWRPERADGIADARTADTAQALADLLRAL